MAKSYKEDSALIDNQLLLEKRLNLETVFPIPVNLNNNAECYSTEMLTCQTSIERDYNNKLEIKEDVMAKNFSDIYHLWQKQIENYSKHKQDLMVENSNLSDKVEQDSKFLEDSTKTINNLSSKIGNLHENLLQIKDGIIKENEQISNFLENVAKQEEKIADIQQSYNHKISIKLDKIDKYSNKNRDLLLTEEEDDEEESVDNETEDQRKMKKNVIQMKALCHTYSEIMELDLSNLQKMRNKLDQVKEARKNDVNQNLKNIQISPDLYLNEPQAPGNLIQAIIKLRSELFLKEDELEEVKRELAKKDKDYNRLKEKFNLKHAASKKLQKYACELCNISMEQQDDFVEVTQETFNKYDLEDLKLANEAVIEVFTKVDQEIGLVKEMLNKNLVKNIAKYVNESNRNSSSLNELKTNKTDSLNQNSFSMESLMGEWLEILEQAKRDFENTEGRKWTIGEFMDVWMKPFAVVEKRVKFQQEGNYKNSKMEREQEIEKTLDIKKSLSSTFGSLTRVQKSKSLQEILKEEITKMTKAL